MLLRIIDRAITASGVREKQSEAAEGPIEVILTHEDLCERYLVDDYSSPLSDNFRRALTWYFDDYPRLLSGSQDDRGCVEKIIKFGQNMGDSLLGEDHQLSKCIDVIERVGYSQLQVRIESGRAEFLAEPWEALILPDSNYILSTQVSAFARKWQTDEGLRTYPERCEALAVTPLASEALGQLAMSDDTTKTQPSIDNPDAPLRVLHLIARPQLLNEPASSSCGLQLATRFASAEGAVDYELLPFNDWQQLQRRLADDERPVHIVHYDGPLLTESRQVSLLLAGNAQQPDWQSDRQPEPLVSVSVEQLATTLVEAGVSLLALDARGYFTAAGLQATLDNPQMPSETLSAAEGLALVARAAERQGLGNVIGLGQDCDPWTSGACLQAVYQQILSALPLAQAIVEARKLLQAQTKSSRFSAEPLEFHPWPLLQHYGDQTLTFFEQPQNLAEPQESLLLQQLQHKLLGFQSRYLPMQAQPLGDGQGLAALQSLSESRAVFLSATAGWGKTQSLHTLSHYLLQSHSVDYGFYFDFREDDYSSATLLEMIAPVLGLAPQQRQQARNKLADIRACFVFDNLPARLESSKSAGANRQQERDCREESFPSLSDFIVELQSDGHLIMAAGEQLPDGLAVDFTELALAPLPALEQQQLAVRVLRQSALESQQQPYWQDFLQSLQGCPLLIQRVIPLLKHSSLEPLTEQVNQLFEGPLEQGADESTPAINLEERFYAWRWQQLPQRWQQLLLLSAQVDGLLLEMLMIVCDRPQTFSPAQSLFELLGVAEAAPKVAEGLDLLELSGFIQATPAGRVIDNRCRQFLLQQLQQADAQHLHEDSLQLCFSQVICEGLRVLGQHVLKQQNPSLSQSLLMHRRSWAQQLERLWFAGDYQGFMAAKSLLDQLLQQANLSADSAAWSLDLLRRSAPVSIADDSSDQAKLCWLALAIQALAQAEVEDLEFLLPGIRLWQCWIDQLAPEPEKSQLPLFQQAAILLESYYQKTSDWSACMAVSQRAYEIYLAYQAWPRVIQCLKSQARSAFELQQDAQGLSLEDKILNDIPYVDAPAGFQLQQWLDVAVARVGRGALQAGQQLLDRLPSLDTNQNFTDLIEGLQADIHYQSAAYELALPHYCKMWKKAQQVGEELALKQLTERLRELQKKLGEAQFDLIFTRELGESASALQTSSAAESVLVH